MDFVQRLTVCSARCNHAHLRSAAEWFHPVFVGLLRAAVTAI